MFTKWRTVTLGLCPTVAAYRAALAAAPFMLDPAAWKRLESVPISPEPVEVDLVLLIGSERFYSPGTYTRPLTRRAVFEQIVGWGLGLCPAEVGPALRLGYRDQPDGEVIAIGMEPLPDPYGGTESHAFTVYRGPHEYREDKDLGAYGVDPGLWLGTNSSAAPGDYWGDVRSVFVLPRA